MNLSGCIAIAAAPFMGSFLGCLADRFPTGAPIVAARSRCDSCNAVIQPLSMIPLLSWCLQGGRCRDCQSPVSVYYPLVELAALLIVVLAYRETSGPIFWVSTALGWSLLTLAAMDVRHMVLSTALMAGTLVLGLVTAWRWSQFPLWQHVVGGLAGAAILLLVNAVYRHVRQRDGLGAGDVWLFAVAGTWITYRGLASVMLAATLVALAGVMIGRIRGNPLEGRTAVPFGAYLCLGIWLTWLYGPLTLGGA